jgi:hypothetical protein
MPTYFSLQMKMMYVPQLMQAFLQLASIQNLAKLQNHTPMKSVLHLTEMPFSFLMKPNKSFRVKAW